LDALGVAKVLIQRIDRLPNYSISKNDEISKAIKELVIDREFLVKEQSRLKNQLHRLLHKSYNSEYREKFKGDGVESNELISYIVDKAKKESGSDYSLLLPLPFLKHLQDVVFANFNIETGNFELSRHSSGYGVADPQKYTDRVALYI